MASDDNDQEAIAIVNNRIELHSTVKAHKALCAAVKRISIHANPSGCSASLGVSEL
jgi:PleD family two-component response regulator